MNTLRRGRETASLSFLNTIQSTLNSTLLRRRRNGRTASLDRVETPAEALSRLGKTLHNETFTREEARLLVCGDPELGRVGLVQLAGNIEDKDLAKAAIRLLSELLIGDNDEGEVTPSSEALTEAFVSMGAFNF